MVVNHLIFADDMCVFSPSISGRLRLLIIICGDYAAEHELAFNFKKRLVQPTFLSHKNINNLLHQMFF